MSFHEDKEKALTRVDVRACCLQSGLVRSNPVCDEPVRWKNRAGGVGAKQRRRLMVGRPGRQDRPSPAPGCGGAPCPEASSVVECSVLRDRAAKRARLASDPRIGVCQGQSSASRPAPFAC